MIKESSVALIIISLLITGIVLGQEKVNGVKENTEKNKNEIVKAIKINDKNNEETCMENSFTHQIQTSVTYTPDFTKFPIRSRLLPLDNEDRVTEILHISDDPGILWWYDLDAPSFGSAATADIDEDGHLEIVFGTYFNDEHIYALNAENGTLLWKYNTGGCNDASPVIADVDQDGELEVVVPASSPYRIYCFNGATGEVEWSRSTGYPNCIDSPPAVADVDNDGKPEIIFGTFYGYVFCLNGENGSICWQINLGTDSYIQSGPNILDIDGDTNLDVVVAQYDGDCRVYALYGINGSIIWYTDVPQDSMYHGGSYADIDEDGKPEIVIGCYDHYIYVFNGEDGSLEWEYQAPFYVAAPTSLADTNNDGHMEIIFLSYNMVGALSCNGSLLWDYYAGGSIFRGVSIADTNNDGVLDVVFGADDGQLRVLSGDTGQVVWIYDLEEHYGQTYNIDHAPIIADFDKDGEMDIFIIGGYGSSSSPDNNHGRAYTLTAGGGVGPGWTMFRHDVYHSGCYPLLPPQIFNVSIYPNVQSMGGFVNITCIVTDNVGVVNVTVNISFPDNSWLNESMMTVGLTGMYYYNASYMLPGNYSFFICATDVEGNGNLSSLYGFTIEESFYYQHFFSKWNLVTVSVENNWTAETFGKNISGCTVVSRFNSSTQTFLTHVVGTQWDNFGIEDGVGYFVYCTHDTTFSAMDFSIPSVTVPIYEDWNIIGWYHDYPTTAESLGDNISGTSVVVMFDAENQTFLTHVVNVPHDNFITTRGMGLFIFTSDESYWTGEG